MAYWFFSFLWFSISSNTWSRSFLCSIFNQKDDASINTKCCRHRFYIREKQQILYQREAAWWGRDTAIRISNDSGRCWRHPWEQRWMDATCGSATWEERAQPPFLSSHLVHLGHSDCGGKPVLIWLSFLNSVSFPHTLGKIWYLGL